MLPHISRLVQSEARDRVIQLHIMYAFKQKEGLLKFYRLKKEDMILLQGFQWVELPWTLGGEIAAMEIQALQLAQGNESCIHPPRVHFHFMKIQLLQSDDAVRSPALH